MSDFGEVRAILHDAPDPYGFERLCALLDAWDDPVELADQVLPYCASHLERWPDEARALPSQAASALARGESPASAPFARSATLRFGATQGIEHAFTSGSLRQMRALRVENARMNAQDAGVIARADLPHLTSLHLGARMHRLVGAQGVAALAPMLPRLALLDLSYTSAGDEGARALAAQPAPRLEDLALTSCQIGDDGVRALAQADWPSLARLELSRGSFGDAALQVLFSSGAMPALERLRALAVPLGPEAVRAAPPTLRELLLSPPVGVDGMLEALPHDRWTTLAFFSGDASARGARALAGRDLSALEALRLSDQRLGDAGAEVLSQAALPALTALSLRGNGLGPMGAAALARAPWLGDVRELDLGANPIGDDGVVALCQADLSSLRALTLGACEVGRRGAEALASNPDLARLEWLQIDLRRAEPRAALALATSPHLPEAVRERWRAVAER